MSNEDSDIKNFKEPSPAKELPERYVIKETGTEKVISCLEAPNLTVRVVAGMTVSGASAKKAPAGTIYLDGAAQSEPFMDHERKVYNLDHHEGCVRPFTLSTCEQVLVMIMKGLDLRDREWNIYANEPDLDTVLAIWLIFNHLRIARKESLHVRFLYALVRLEGVIDALGLELREFSGLPTELLRKAQRVIDFLRRREIRLKKEGLWQETDFQEYTVGVLHQIDRILYKTGELTDFKGIKELARVDLTDDRIVAVVEAESGIYELEAQLNHLYGSRLGLVALRKSPQTYTLRRMDLFMPGDLEPVYERLNFLDPAVRGSAKSDRWGGSADIGGSPRASGTRLSPREIAHACRHAMQKADIRSRVLGFFKQAAMIAAVVAACEILRKLWPGIAAPNYGIFQFPSFSADVLLLLLSAALLTFTAFQRPWQHGMTFPAGKDWWSMLPAVILFAWMGGIVVPLNPQNPLEQLAHGVVVLPLATEILFRGVTHGILAGEHRIQHSGSSWFLSWPTLVSSVLYALFVGYRAFATDGDLSSVLTNWDSGNILAAFACGTALGMARERSDSLYTAWLFHAAAALFVLFIRTNS
ncbi:MAG TPA: type II CAAX prenyl endopeptidase Rce1 family protein [Desulfobacterales bacterium]